MMIMMMMRTMLVIMMMMMRCTHLHFAVSYSFACAVNCEFPECYFSCSFFLAKYQE